LLLESISGIWYHNLVVSNTIPPSFSNTHKNTQFVEKGFVKLRASVSRDAKRGQTGFVCIYVEDSGCGIPMEKRAKLFSKFQESLDSLHQGTGIGLAVCRHLIDLMGGDIVLDETYHSGIEGCPGARFVVHLNQSPIEVDEEGEEENKFSRGDKDPEQGMEKPQSAPPASFLATSIEQNQDSHKVGVSGSDTGDSRHLLPPNLRILFVDDDYLLRRLFRRSLEKMMPTWVVEEAASGETALRMIEEEECKPYDLIFVDQYMSSVSKQMLGTETVRALRASGNLTSNTATTTTGRTIICGLSANDMERQFHQAGADSFLMKPFPCDKKSLSEELCRILNLPQLEEQQQDPQQPADSSPNEKSGKYTISRIHSL
jgi:CheY-like chemotaxis protein